MSASLFGPLPFGGGPFLIRGGGTLATGNAWRTRHAEAFVNPEPGHESALVGMLSAWAEYAPAHKAYFDGLSISDDYYTGPEWLAIGQALRRLLSCPTGRLDAGIIDGFIVGAIEAAGFEDWE